MAKVVWTAGALQDLDQIAGFIAVDNADAADRLVTRVFAKAKLLETFPELGRHVPEFSDQVHRELIVAPCRVVYRFKEKTVFIELVIRGQRLMREELLKRK
jgi:plasmid stabilization system protein ParE